MTQSQILDLDQHLHHSTLLECLTLLRSQEKCLMSSDALLLNRRLQLRLTHTLLHSPIPCPIHSEILALNRSLAHNLAQALSRLETRTADLLHH